MDDGSPVDKSYSFLCFGNVQKGSIVDCINHRFGTSRKKLNYTVL